MKPLTYLINCAPEEAPAEWHQSGEEFKDSEDVVAVIAYSEYQAQARRIAELENWANSLFDTRTKNDREIESLRKQVEILQRPLDDQIISRIVCLVKNIPDEELASNVFESVRNMTNWNKSTPAEFLVLFDKTAESKNGE